jgi:hypothetical protein
MNLTCLYCLCHLKVLPLSPITPRVPHTGGGGYQITAGPARPATLVSPGRISKLAFKLNKAQETNPVPINLVAQRLSQVKLPITREILI